MGSKQGMIRLGTEGWVVCMFFFLRDAVKEMMKKAVCHFKLVSFRGQIKLEPHPDWSPFRV